MQYEVLLDDSTFRLAPEKPLLRVELLCNFQMFFLSGLLT